MDYISYSQKLKDPRWQKKRLAILNRDNWTCTHCQEDSKELHVHHAYYISGRMPWEYPSGTLSTVCSDCHKYINNNPTEPQAWEDFVAVSNECCAASAVNPIPAFPDVMFEINLFCYKNGIKSGEFLGLLAGGLDACVIDHETLLKWKLAASQKEELRVAAYRQKKEEA